MVATILVADDESGIRRLAKRVLELAGHTVLEAVDGQEAFDIVQEHQPELALLDLWMPKRSGLEVSSLIRSNPTLSQTRIIVTSGDSLSDLTQFAEAGLIDDYLRKPFSLTQLLETGDHITQWSKAMAHRGPQAEMTAAVDHVAGPPTAPSF